MTTDRTFPRSNCHSDASTVKFESVSQARRSHTRLSPGSIAALSSERDASPELTMTSRIPAYSRAARTASSSRERSPPQTSSSWRRGRLAEKNRHGVVSAAEARSSAGRGSSAGESIGPDREFECASVPPWRHHRWRRTSRCGKMLRLGDRRGARSSPARPPRSTTARSARARGDRCARVDDDLRAARGPLGPARARGRRAADLVPGASGSAGASVIRARRPRGAGRPSRRRSSTTGAPSRRRGPELVLRYAEQLQATAQRRFASRAGSLAASPRRSSSA